MMNLMTRPEFDRVFEGFFSPVRGSGTWPRLEVAEGDEEVTVRAELPGMKAEDIDIQVSGDVLTLSGERKESAERSKENVYHSEWRFGAFHRTVSLPSHVARDKVTAEYKDGLLTIRLPHAEEARARRIEIRS